MIAGDTERPRFRLSRTKYSGAWKMESKERLSLSHAPNAADYIYHPSRYTNSSARPKDRAGRGIGIRASNFFRADSIYSTENVVFTARFFVHCRGWLLPEYLLSVGLRSNRTVGMTVPVFRRATGRAPSMNRYESQILVLAHFSGLPLRFRSR